MKRKQLAPRTRSAEKAAITQFVFDAVQPAPDAQTPIQAVFDAYQGWRDKNQLPPSALNIDGFGRLFPHIYPRKSAYWPPVKHFLNCVYGLEIKC